MSSCFHCGQPVPDQEKFEELIEGQSRPFCCIGCKAVCKAIFDAGLQGFYQRTPEGTLLAPPPEPPKDIGIYDIDEVQSEFVDELGDERDIHLLVEGIHCAACIWLIEHTLGQLPGVLSASVNLSARRVQLRWDNRQIKLSAILRRLAAVGYAAVPFDPEAAEGTLKRQNRSLLFRMAFAGFAMMNLMWVSIALYTGADQGEFRGLFEWIGFGLATPTLLYSGWPFLRGAWSSLRQRHATMDLPIAIGASVTYLYSSYVLLFHPPQGGVYFDTVVNFIFVILIGRHLESLSKRHAVSATQRLVDLQPRVATVLIDGEERISPIRSVKNGDRVLVKPGDRIPVDGEVLEGRSSVDEAMLSGESAPAAKGVGDRVSAGTINLEGALTLSVEGTLKNTALGRIIRLVEDAQASKPPIQCTTDRIVPWFVTATLGLAALTFLYWMQTDFELALMAATAVMIITCPCAAGLSVPMAVAVASGEGARHGIMIKNGTVLEVLADINHFVFDKTGTLTEGKMRVEAIHSQDIDELELLALCASAERYSEHTIATAIRQAANERQVSQRYPAVEEFTNVPGLGIAAHVAERRVLLGSEQWLRQNGVVDGSPFSAETHRFEEQGVTCIHVAVDGRQVGLIALADQLRPDALGTIQRLRDSGIRLTLLSGDRRRVAEAVAERLGGMEVIAEVLPDDKDRVIVELQHRGAKVAMVGDGVNDAPALIRADVGISLGSGTDVSTESADIVLMSNELEKIHLAAMLSRRTLRTIRQNLGLSFAYNVVMIPLAMAAFITPLFAAIAMPFSSLAVIGNAARIRSVFKKVPRP
ncbi:MAG TPA: heavy metal translocating P-type ATPase [Gammaproteobacteria bacterium]